MPNPTLITGCVLHVPAEGKAVWGDLWGYGSCFVFNANVHGFDTAWLYGDEAEILAARESVIQLLPEVPYFDRRGVVVFETLHSTFSSAAREHMLRWNPDFNLEYHHGPTA
jgi:hypothetical protein